MIIKKNKQKQYDVIIIGAGFSGLAAALKLKEHKLKILILEADDDIGGRSWNKVLDNGTLIELGGQWVGWHHKRMLDFIKKYKIKKYTTPPFPTGKALFKYQNKIIDKFPVAAEKLLATIDKIVKEIDIEKPWNHPIAKIWDNITFEAWLEMQEAPLAAKKIVARIIAGGLLSRDASHISMLQTLFYVASNGGVEVALAFSKGAQHYRVMGGSFKIAKSMAQTFSKKELLLNEPATMVNYENNAIKVLTMNNNVYQANYLIMAIPPVLAGKIHYIPSLPAYKYGILQNFPGGDALKIHFIYERPFWRDKNYSGSAYLQEGWLTEITDNSVPNDLYFVLTGFVYGNKKRELTQKKLSARKKFLLQELVSIFGAEAQDIIKYVEYDWLNSPWTGGCFSGSLRIGCWATYGKHLLDPIKGIHWASSELSTRFNGYFEGAILSGERAANEVLQAIKDKM